MTRTLCQKKAIKFRGQSTTVFVSNQSQNVETWIIFEQYSLNEESEF